MTGGAGERLFEAIGQLPDEMILEAEKDEMLEECRAVSEADADNGVQDLNPDMKGQDVKKQDNKNQDGKMQIRWLRRDKRTAKSGWYLKFLPVAACLCIVFGSAFYMLNHRGNDGFSGFDGGSSKDADMAMMENGAADDAGAADEASGSGGADAGRTTSGSADAKEQAEEDMKVGTNDGAEWGQTSVLPVRYDAYEGPVFPVTATGDTQKLKTKRSLKGEITTEKDGEERKPLLHITDVYEIKNTSNEGKTLQLVYPFAATLNLADGAEGEILQIQGPDGSLQTPVTYSLGDSVRAYLHKDSARASSMEDYEQLMNENTEYQERALEKEADWNREVSLYTFSEIKVQEDFQNRQGVIGVTVNGADADVLTYGFDYSSEIEAGITNYCFFIPEEEEKVMLIVTGDPDGEPELGFYSNLDCEEQIDGVDCEMTKQKMSYADALHICSSEAVKQLARDYEQEVYEGELPEYMNGDAAFGALTVISEEETFYDTLISRYQSTELKEVFGKLFGETRIVYAMSTVTIPAKQSVRVTVQMKKSQSSGHYRLMDAGVSSAPDQEDLYRFQYDFLSASQSQLSIKKTNFQLVLADEWQAADNDMELKQKKTSVWKAVLRQNSYYLMIEDAAAGHSQPLF